MDEWTEKESLETRPFKDTLDERIENTEKGIEAFKNKDKENSQPMYDAINVYLNRTPTANPHILEMDDELFKD